MFAHMQEAHMAIVQIQKVCSYEQTRLAWEWKADIFSKLVALCIRTTAVLSNKKYGLDKAYMRLNLEKRRIMHAIGKLEVPQRTRVGVPLPRAPCRARPLVNKTLGTGTRLPEEQMTLLQQQMHLEI